MSNNITVAVLGASPKPDRYSNRAIKMLKEHGYHTVPVHPKFSEIEGLPVAARLADIESPVHTLSLYVGPARLEPMTGEILALKPGRVIFNPGTESETVQNSLAKAGIPWLKACTLVMLQTNQF